MINDDIHHCLIIPTGISLQVVQKLRNSTLKFLESFFNGHWAGHL